MNMYTNEQWKQKSALKFCGNVNSDQTSGNIESTLWYRLYIKQMYVFITLKIKAFETSRKKEGKKRICNEGDIAGNWHFLLFPSFDVLFDIEFVVYKCFKLG